MEPTIDCQELFLRLGDDEVVVVDCRDEDDWTRYQFQIPGAVKMSVQEMRDWAHVLPDDELIVLCGCATDGSDTRRAFRQLQLRGRHGRVLRGGLREWISEGFPTERRPPRVLEADETLLAAH